VQRSKDFIINRLRVNQLSAILYFIFWQITQNALGIYTSQNTFRATLYFKMAAEIANNLEEEALKRKERLRAMRQKSGASGDQESEVSYCSIILSLRSAGILI
jgi:hypothetical protein